MAIDKDEPGLCKNIQENYHEHWIVIEDHSRSNRRLCMTKQDSTRKYRTLKNCITLYDILQDLARPYGPYTTIEDYTKPCTTIQNQREQYHNKTKVESVQPGKDFGFEYKLSYIPYPLFLIPYKLS